MASLAGHGVVDEKENLSANLQNIGRRLTLYIV